MDVIRGDAFTYAFAVEVDGAPQDLTNWQVTAAVFVPFTRSFAIEIDWIDRAAGTFSINPDTSTWPFGAMQFAIRYTTDAGDPFTTNFQPVNVKQGIPN